MTSPSKSQRQRSLNAVVQNTLHYLSQQHLLPDHLLQNLLLYSSMSEVLQEILAIKRVDHHECQWQPTDLATFSTLGFTHRYDLAVVVTAEVSLLPQTLQRCRDLFARYTLVLCPACQDLTRFGFSRFGDYPITIDEKIYHAWQFNLFNYKHLPDWLNSRFWANPENWDKYRW